MSPLAISSKFIEIGTRAILNQGFDARSGRAVPSAEGVPLTGGAVVLDCTVLYADLCESSRLASDFPPRTAAKIVRSFVYCMTKLITTHRGTVTSFDGDRVMGVYRAKSQRTDAVATALKMNYAVAHILRPLVSGFLAKAGHPGFVLSHGVGVDSGRVLAVRAGHRGSNDLVWIGRAPNMAAKLSDVREDGFCSYISSEAYVGMDASVTYSNMGEMMWEAMTVEFAGEAHLAYRSGWWWAF